MARRGRLLSWDDINKIRLMKARGYTIREIVKATNTSIQTVQKYIHTENKNPTMENLLQRLEELEMRINKLENKEQPDGMGSLWKENRTNENTQNRTKENTIKPEEERQETVSIRELSELTGYAERTLQKKAKNLGYTKVKRTYKIPRQDVDKFK